jgi:hypothetical protein
VVDLVQNDTQMFVEDDMQSFVKSVALVVCGRLLGVIGTERMLAQQSGVRVNHVRRQRKGHA